MKKFFILLLTLTLVLGVCAPLSLAAKAKVIKVSKVKINPTKLTLEVGAKETLTAVITPSNATDKAVTWKSDKTKIAAVSSKGEVTAKAVGTAKITVTTKDGKKANSITVTVKKKSDPKQDPINNKNLLGVWSETPHQQIHTADRWIEFKSNGTFEYYYSYNKDITVSYSERNQVTIKGNYAVSGNRINVSNQVQTIIANNDSSKPETTKLPNGYWLFKFRVGPFPAEYQGTAYVDVNWLDINMYPLNEYGLNRYESFAKLY